MWCDQCICSSSFKPNVPTRSLHRKNRHCKLPRHYWQRKKLCRVLGMLVLLTLLIVFMVAARRLLLQLMQTWRFNSGVVNVWLRQQCTSRRVKWARCTSCLRAPPRNRCSSKGRPTALTQMRRNVSRPQYKTGLDAEHLQLYECHLTSIRSKQILK